MYYYVNILLTKNALNTFISNENNFVQNQLLRSADSISFSFIPVAYRWLEGLSKDCVFFWLTAILYYKSRWRWSYSSSVPSRILQV